MLKHYQYLRSNKYSDTRFTVDKIARYAAKDVIKKCLKQPTGVLIKYFSRFIQIQNGRFTKLTPNEKAQRLIDLNQVELDFVTLVKKKSKPKINFVKPTSPRIPQCGVFRQVGSYRYVTIRMHITARGINRHRFTHTAGAAARTGTKPTASALIANGVMADLGIITKDDKSATIDRNKVSIVKCTEERGRLKLPLNACFAILIFIKKKQFRGILFNQCQSKLDHAIYQSTRLDL